MAVALSNTGENQLMATSLLYVLPIALLYVVVTRTRLGMLIRAGASNRTMVAALGVNIRALYTLVFGSVTELIASIEEFLEATNDDPKPYVWTATAESILAKVARARATLEQVVS